MRTRNVSASMGMVATLAGACAGEDVGEATLTINASGESAAVGGYPAGTGEDEIKFADGWTVEFSHVLVSISGFELKSAAGDDAMLTAEPVVADLHRGDPALWKFEGVPARRWDRVGYRFTPPTGKARKANAVDSALFERMQDEGYSLFVAGTARKGDRALELEYGFPFSLQMTKCQNGQDGTDGLVVRENGVEEAQITVHLDHLFFDSWAREEPDLRFDAMAAVAPESGPLTLENLAEQDNLSDLKGADGKPLELAYDPGSAFEPVPENLEEYVEAGATTIGHWNGEGHCDYARE